MADPAWSAQYLTNQSPEGNGFSRVIHGSPVIDTITGGAPANRRVEIVSDAGDVCFVTTQVPAFTLNTGCTGEIVCATTGAGNAGFEITFLDGSFGVQVYSDAITVYVPDGQGPRQYATNANTTDVTIRATVATDRTLTVYRQASLVATLAIPNTPSPFQRFLWWGEEGGTQTFKGMRYYIGGAVAP